jgi:hypothetical protein
MPEFGQYFFGFSLCQCPYGKSVKKKLEHTSISSWYYATPHNEECVYIEHFFILQKAYLHKEKKKGGDFVKRNVTYRGINKDKDRKLS